MTATLTALVEAVRAELDSISGVVAQGGASLTEGITDFVTIQVTPESGQGAYNSRSDRNTFGKGLAQRQWTINVDVYARQRSHIGEDMAAVMSAADDVIAALDAQTASPPFGVAGVHTWHYTWQRVVFSYGNPDTRYVGIRFVLTFMCR